MSEVLGRIVNFGMKGLTGGMLALFLIGGSASAQSLAQAKHLLDQGEFMAAAEEGTGLDSAEGEVIAARALTYYGRFLAPEAERETILKQAIGHAERAVAIAPDSAEAYVELAHASGRYARQIGVLAAMNEGFAERIKKALDQAIALDPDNAAALVSRGSWNAEIVSSAGRIMASVLYGASRSDALADYERALAEGGTSPGIYREVARGLLLLDEKEFGERARGLLEKAIALPAATAIDRIDQDRAQTLLMEMKT
ncbi:MAG: hypothetical protein CMM50_02685 [Rhodospirillaceae bacterium]|jgi:tetratricopeptide (TPR) repeat protein|nr:hypothetical protein [Rhodospirillaceae bacterium]|tara:strand:- start:280 stop:1044 length:765 start_codon:yes stop_codon:yes gene_type:complete